MATITGTSNADTLTGTSGPDSIVGLAGDDSILGGAGNDTIDGGGGVNTIDGGAGFNFVSYAAETDAVTVYTFGTSSSMSGGAREDRLYNIQGLIGSNYGDVLVGDLNANALSGGGGADTLLGGGGNDTLTGGAGNDIFSTSGAAFSPSGVGQTIITDFTHGQDRIDVSNAGFATFDSLKPHLSQVGADTVLSITYNGQQTSYTLKNVSLATLGASDFIFPPTAPTNLTDAAIVSGHVDAAHNTAAQVLTGIADKGALVIISNGGVGLGSATADASTGAWSFTLGHLAEGTYSLAAKAVNQVGPSSLPLIFTVSPPAPIIGTDNPDTLTGTSGDDSISGLAGADSLVGGGGNDTISGGDGNDTIDGGDGYDVIDGGAGYNIVTYASASAGVAVSLQPDLSSMGAGAGPDTLYNIQGVIGSNYNDILVGDLNANSLSGGAGDDTIDGGGGADTLGGGSGADLLTGGAGNDVFLVDGAGQKTITDFTHGQDKIDVSTAGISSFASLTPHLTQVGADTVLSVTYNGQAASFTLKNVSLATLDAGDFVFAPASSAPAAPSGLADAAIVGGYVNAAHDIAAQALTGTADKGATVTVYDGATKLGTAVANATTGAWSYTLGHLADGAHTLTATATDAGGHLSVASPALSFKVDTLGPSTPNGLADASIAQGYVNAAHNLAGQALTGKTDAGATVTVYDGATQLGAVKAGAGGAWSYVLGPLAEGGHKLSATATDAAGNTSVASNVLVFTVDTHAPGAPASLADTAIVGGYVNAAHDLAAQALTGKAEAYSTVAVYDGATKLGVVQASGTGTWSYTLGKLSDGAHSLTATTIDKAGNVGPSSGALAFAVDTHAPAASIGKAVVGAVSTTLSLSGVSEPGASVVISEGGTKLGSAVADASGAWSLTLSGLTNTLHNLGLSATDLAGNKATAGPTLYSPAANATIVGSAASDLLIGRPGDTLTGGAGSDRFIFGAKAGHETITDFTPSTSSTVGDVLQIDHTLATSFANLMSHAVQVGANVSISFPSGDSLVLQNLQRSSLHAGDFLFV